MAIGSAEAFRERLNNMKPNVYIDGKAVDRTGSWNDAGYGCMKITYDMCNEAEFEDVCTATSHLTGEKVSRFNHIHQSKEDLLKKQLMTRLLCHRVGGCTQRCMGVDALNALAVVTHDCDEACGTEYEARFEKYLLYCQANDLVHNCAQTDVKGSRNPKYKRAHQQPDPDQFLHIVETGVDGVGLDGKPTKGIIVRGAKVCNSCAPYVDEIIATPTKFMGKGDEAYAVSFALPADWDGVMLMALPGLHHKRSRLEAPYANAGDVESMTIFNDVFVPDERVFLNGLDTPDVVQYAGYLALMFAHFHRHSYCGCKAAISEIIAAQAALIADVNDIAKEHHVREKLSDLVGTAELVFAAGQAAAHRAVQFPNGSYVPDEILTNAGRKLAGTKIYHEYEILADLTGGICASLPTEECFFAPETAELVNKYIMRNPDYTAEETHRVLRMMENRLCDPFEAAQAVAGVHGGGSPLMETITMMSRYDLDPLKQIAKYLAGFPGVECPRFERETVTPRKMLERF
ncbi:MAG: aromatic ring hydroxylase, partial [Clostridiales Family XIII bacterium]|nr:aromatic ring hydroxylase [Clostridiales Family XIII bacterium]